MDKEKRRVAAVITTEIIIIPNPQVIQRGNLL